MLGRSKPKSAITKGYFYVPRQTREDGIFASDRDEDYIFVDFFKILARERGRQLPELVLKYPDNAINEYLKNYGLVIVMLDHEGNKFCYSRNYRNNLPTVFTDQIKSHLQIMPSDTVFWSDDIFKEPREVSAGEVIYGERISRPSSRKTLAQKQKDWAHPQELTKDELDYLSGKTNQPPPTP
jgi:hypothetical protein